MQNNYSCFVFLVAYTEWSSKICDGKKLIIAELSRLCSYISADSYVTVYTIGTATVVNGTMNLQFTDNSFY